MKKVLSLLLCAVMLLALAACAAQEPASETDSGSQSATADPTVPAQPESTEASETAETPETNETAETAGRPAGGRGQPPEFSHPNDRPWEWPSFPTDWATDNFSDEMKSYSGSDLDPFSGADLFERSGDHADSPYYINNDWYNIESGGSLTILSHFKTIQQTDQKACAVDCALMVMEYYGLRGDWTEAGLLPLRRDHNTQHTGTCLDQMIDIFTGVGGFEYLTTYGYPPHMVTAWLLRSFLQRGVPVLVGWSAWGGHWNVIIGYDDMGTPFNEYDDVLIFADSYDMTDHNQDGYTTYSAQRFFTEWSFYNTVPDDGTHVSERIFVAAWPAT